MDDKIDKLNRRISRLLGKKDSHLTGLGNNPQHNKQDDEMMSNRAYLLVMIICVLVLWLATGIYYVSETNYAVIIVNGTVKRVVNGPAIGVTAPLPFASVVLIDNSTSSMKSIALSEMDNDYMALSKDNIPLLLTAHYSYKVIDPQRVYDNLALTKNNIENTVKLNLLVAMQQTLAKDYYANLKTTNLTILAKDVLNQANYQLSQNGLNIVKVNINKLQPKFASIQENVTSLKESNSSEANKIASNLLTEAHAYSQDQLAQAKIAVNNYSLLMHQYNHEPQAVVAQMYYDTLAYLASNQACKKYNYLPLSLSELYAKLNQNDENNRASVGRDVVRARTYR